jgi:hypothetical protein
VARSRRARQPTAGRLDGDRRRQGRRAGSGAARPMADRVGRASGRCPGGRFARSGQQRASNTRGTRQRRSSRSHCSFAARSSGSTRRARAADLPRDLASHPSGDMSAMARTIAGCGVPPGTHATPICAVRALGSDAQRGTMTYIVADHSFPISCDSTGRAACAVGFLACRLTCGLGRHASLCAPQACRRVASWRAPRLGLPGRLRRSSRS